MLFLIWLKIKIFFYYPNTYFFKKSSKTFVNDSNTIIFAKNKFMTNFGLLLKVASQLYVKNPNSSNLGQKIITNSIEMIDNLGFEKFTFKKLSIQINSTESSIYRYFENKHQLLVYLASWYWNWVYYQISLATLNIDSDIVKLKNAITILTTDIKEDPSISHINEITLNRIIITEFSKVIHTKDVDTENKNGWFESYKKVINKVTSLILAVNKNFIYAQMLVTTIIEGAQQQRYYTKHLPSITNTKKDKNAITNFYTDMVFKMILQQ